MITSIYCNGLTIGTWDSGYLFKKLTGFDYPSVRLNVKDMGNYHGARYGSAYFGARVLGIEGEIIADSPEDYEIKRRALGQAFTILNGLQSVVFTTRAGMEVKADCIVNNRLEMPYSAGDMQRGEFRIELIAPFPFFLSTESNTTRVFIFEGTGGQVPSEIPFNFSGGSAGNVDVVNLGNMDAYPIIRLWGIMNDPVIKNNTTGLQLSIDYALAGEDDYIELNTFLHTAKLGNGTNVFNKVSGDWWTLRPDINNIVLTASSYGAGARAEIIYEYHYLGV